MKRYVALLFSMIVFWQIHAQSCQAFFTIASGSQCNVFEFTDASTSNDSIVQWEYNFDDGTNTFSSSPQHMYIANGVYQVCLTITDVNNCTSQYCNEVEVTCLGTDCIEPLIIDQGIICGMIYMPVCGCDTVTYSNECEAIYYFGVTSYVPGECALSVKENDALDVTWGPNPVQNELKLTINESREGQYLITTANGALVVQSDQLSVGQSVINTKNLTKGMYFLHLTVGNRKKTIRFIKH